MSVKEIKKSEIFYDKGIDAMCGGNFDEAIVAFNEVITLNPEHRIAHYNLAKALQESEKFEEAIVGFDRALVLHPEELVVMKQLYRLWKKERK